MPATGCPSNASQASFHQSQRLLRLPSPRRLGLWTTSSLLSGFPREAITPAAPTSRATAHAGGDPKQQALTLRARTLAREERCGEGQPGAEHEHESEHGAVLRPNAARLSVLRDTGQRQGDRDARGSRHGGRHERGHAVEALSGQPEPEPEHDERRENAPARVREDERDEQRVEHHDRARLDDARVTARASPPTARVGSPKTTTSASAFQYPTGERSRASRP